MTLIEVLAALVILTGALTGMALFVARFARTVADSGVRATASDLVAERLETVKAAARYVQIDAFVSTESVIAGFPRYRRQTLVRHVGGQPSDTDDYKVVTVIVTAPALRQPVKKTTVIGSF
jgi:Tfp pilus assembly protein PilV